MSVLTVTKRSFGQRLAAAMTGKGPLCAGIDPHPHLLSAWGFNDDVAGLATFTEAAYRGLREAAILKPQMAFFERFGSAGIAVLEDLLAQARADGVLTVVDVKRGDIGSTMDGYASAYLECGAALECDAITVSPYLGPAVFDATADLALRNAKGLFLLVLTSNPQAITLQRATLDLLGENGAAPGFDEGAEPANVARLVLEWLNQRNHAELGGPVGSASLGSVIGATVEDVETVLGASLAANTGPILAPGFGVQGASAQQIAQRFAPVRDKVLVNASRSLLSCGPQVEAMAEEVSRLQTELRNALQ